jgi:hypothetical protein
MYTNSLSPRRSPPILGAARGEGMLPEPPAEMAEDVGDGNVTGSDAELGLQDV